jgi:hypothetical protein
MSFTVSAALPCFLPASKSVLPDVALTLLPRVVLFAPVESANEPHPSNPTPSFASRVSAPTHMISTKDGTRRKSPIALTGNEFSECVVRSSETQLRFWHPLPPQYSIHDYPYRACLLYDELRIRHTLGFVSVIHHRRPSFRELLFSLCLGKFLYLN